ncbi:MAG: protein translocase subunit SecD [Candidatus Eisenbacteria bacterium]
MGKNRLRLILVIAALVLGAWYVYPTFRVVTLSDEKKAAMGPEAFAEYRSKALNLGLDLQGGMHLVLQVDRTKLSEDEASDAVDRALEIIRNRVDQFGVAEPSIQRQGDDRIVVQLPGVRNPLQAKSLIGQTALLEFKLVRSSSEFTETLRRVDDYLYERYKKSGGEKEQKSGEEGDEESDGDQESAEGNDEAEAGETKEGESDASALDGQGAEPTPGDTTKPDPGDTAFTGDDFLAEETKAQDEASRQSPLTSRLRFFRTGEQDNGWVPEDNIAQVESLLAVPGVRGLIPFGASFAWGRDLKNYGDADMKALYLIDDRAELTGKSVSNAIVQVGLDSNRPNTPGVSLTLTGEGAHDFSRITGNNVGRRLAIVLDGKVHSAPNIIDKIPHGRASITGQFDFDEAKVLAIVLRAGALPAPLEIMEERTVGPSLGRDSIRMGVRAAIFGGIVVVVFMIFYYKGAGVIANVALVLNLVFLMAALSGLHATLTLPGIAGIILTIGMAVDANVLIFERIREELRNRKTVRASIESGYGRAFRTILDANVTTLITAFVLLQFGTASIKGFAVTLSIGILTSMFTALVVTRLIFDFMVDRFAVKKLSI